MANITIDGVTKEYPDGLKYEVIASEYQQQYDNMIALVLENGKIRELIKPVYKDCTLSFLTLKDVIGHKTYVRTAIMTLIKSVYDVLEDKEITKVNVEFAIGQGYYVNIKMDEADTGNGREDPSKNEGSWWLRIGRLSNGLIPLMMR